MTFEMQHLKFIYFLVESSRKIELFYSIILPNQATVFFISNFLTFSFSFSIYLNSKRKNNFSLGWNLAGYLEQLRDLRCHNIQCESHV